MKFSVYQTKKTRAKFAIKQKRKNKISAVELRTTNPTAENAQTNAIDPVIPQHPRIVCKDATWRSN